MTVSKDNTGLIARPFLGKTHLEGPPSCKDALMMLSIAPCVAFMTFGFALYPAISLIILSLLVVTGWLPVIIGFFKSALHKPETIKPLTDTELPKLTILLPLHEEANMLQQLADMLNAIDYPSEKLDCLVLLEAVDTPTAIAAMRIGWPDFTRILSVPKGVPQTEARACNYALAYARGELLVIFDAEDMPHPQQMREAAAKFAAADDTLACLQAPLRIYPRPGSWSQAQFALEYRVLFSFILPHLSAAMSCLPLGGSSNYFRRAALNHVGGWDDYNLTEDADLALRLAGFGYRIGTLSLETLENAPHKISIWFFQRTRWQSGHIQLLHAYALWSLRRLVQKRSPAKEAFKWRFVMLACILVLAVRLFSGLLFIASAAIYLMPTNIYITPLFLYLSLGFYPAYAVILFIYAPADNWVDKIGLVVTHPIYWMMTFPAQIYALIRMACGQTGWLKSPHQPYVPDLRRAKSARLPTGRHGTPCASEAALRRKDAETR